MECATYSQILLDESEFFDEMSVKALGRSVKHVILLHETDLNALCLGELVKTLRAHRWEIISPDEAYKDPIASQEPKAETKLNQGRVFALAQESGYKGRLYSKWNELESMTAEMDRQGVWTK